MSSASPSNDQLVVRSATFNDIDQIVRLNALAYPQIKDQDILWRRDHLESHLRIFNDGQIVVEDAGRVVAASSSLVVNLGRDDFREHTWAGITDNGMFFNHDPFGDTLYGADTNVHPDYRRRGLATMIYEARRDLCRRLNLRRIVLGGRLYNFIEYADRMAVEEYAENISEGDLIDPVLTFQLKNGFVIKKILPNYLKDTRSQSYATFLEWLNPSYKARYRKSRSIRVSAVQYRMRKIANFEEFARQVRYFAEVAQGYESDFVIFPELLTAQLMSFIDTKTPQQAIRELTEYTPQVDALFTELSRELQMGIVNGSHPTRDGERILNISSLHLPDGTVFRQPKIHVTPNERRWWGIEGGSTLKVFDTPKARVGILICYDVEFPEAARYLSDQGAEVIFVPFCTDDRQAYLRVRYCAQARAVENQVYVAMAGTVGNLPEAENMDIQYAQSAVFSPSDFAFARDGILVETTPNTEMIITTDLDFETLEESIKSGSVRQRRDRRPDLFRFVCSLPEGEPER